MTTNLQLDKTAGLGGKAAWYALFLITSAQAVSMMDRQILAILIPRIKLDLNVGDTEMGLLYGTVFGLFYALFSLPLGRLADGWNRAKQLGLSVIGWSFMTSLAGFANSFGVLAISRLGVGIGEASVSPAGFSILSDVFPKKMRGTISAFMAASVSIGLGCAIWFGAGVADYWDAKYTADNAPLGFSAWQAAFVLAAIPGLVIGILMLRLPEPIRGLSDGVISKKDPHPIRESVLTFTSTLPVLAWLSMARLKVSAKYWCLNIAGLMCLIGLAVAMTTWTNSLRADNSAMMNIGSFAFSANALQWSLVAFGGYVLLNWMQSMRLRDYPTFVLLTSPSMVLMILVVVLQFILNYSIMAWTPAFLMHQFDKTSGEIGAAYGIIIMSLGIIGPMVAGPLSDKLHKKFDNGRVLLAFLSVTLSAGLVSWVYDAASLEQFYWRFVPFSLILTMWLPPLYASFMDLVLPRMRGTVMSFYILTSTIFGMGLGPYLTGLISDSSGQGLGSALVDLYWISPLIAILALALVFKFSRDHAQVVDRAVAAGEKLER